MLTKLLAPRSRHALATLLAALFALALVFVSSADASNYLHTWKTSIDVKLKVTEISNWNGIRAGCYAPQESFGMTYRMNLDSTPKKSSKIVRSVATLTKKSFGTTPGYGAKGSFTQVGEPGQWTVQSELPAGCSGTAVPPPSWVVNPVCKPVSERVQATLLQTDITDPDDNDGSLNDGTLLLMRTPKAKPAASGASIGDGCYRTLQDIYPVGVQSLLNVSPNSTVIEIPVPKLKNKLIKLATGPDKSNPSFRISINVSGDCKEMHMTPYTGPHPDFTLRSFTEPHNALGDAVDNPANSSCTLRGKGHADVTRESAVVSTDIPGR